MKSVTIILCMMFLLVTPLFADCTSADKKALEDLDRAWGAASIAGDRAALEQFYASDYMGNMPGNMENHAETIDNTVRDAEKSKSMPQPKVTYDAYIISCTANSATITHRNTFVPEDGHGEVRYTRSVHFLEKRNSKWLVVSNAGHPMNDATQVMYLENDWNTADLAGDVAWFEKHFASDMTSISGHTGKQTNKAEELADLKSRKDVTTSADLSNLDVRKEGDIVVTTGINRVKGKAADGKMFDRRIAFTDVWVKRDGRWQVLATQGTDIKYARTTDLKFERPGGSRAVFASRSPATSGT